VEDEPRAGRPSTSKTDDNVERVRTLVRSDRRLTLRMISNELNLNWFTIHNILTQDLDDHDNTPCHTEVSINEFLTEKSIHVVPKPPFRRISVPVTSFYSPGSKPT
jgi:hypothetical protein